MTPTLMCLALNVFFEARGEPLDGKLMVIETTLNRVEDSRYPDDVCSVVYEPYAFSWTHDDKSDDPLSYPYLDRLKWEEIRQLVEVVSKNEQILLGTNVTHYHKAGIEVFWSKHYEYVGLVGSHMFYENKTPYK